MFALRPLLTFSFWFDATPGELLTSTVWVLFILYLVAIVLAIGFSKYGKRTHGTKAKRLFFAKLQRIATTLGLVGFILLFFMYERAAVISMRALTGFLLLGCLAWLIAVLVWYRKAMRTRSPMDRVRQVVDKYLPR